MFCNAIGSDRDPDSSLSCNPFIDSLQSALKMRKASLCMIDGNAIEVEILTAGSVTRVGSLIIILCSSPVDEIFVTTIEVSSVAAGATSNSIPTVLSALISTSTTSAVRTVSVSSADSLSA